MVINITSSSNINERGGKRLGRVADGEEGRVKSNGGGRCMQEDGGEKDERKEVKIKFFFSG